MLGNIYDFSPLCEYGHHTDEIEVFLHFSSDQKDAFSIIDRWCLVQVGQFVDNTINRHLPLYKYESIVAEADQLVSKLSGIYFNAVKDVYVCVFIFSSSINLSFLFMYKIY